MDSTLHTDLGSAALPCFDAAPSYFFGTYVIRLTAQILAATAFRKGTELTFEIADVGVIDIAVNHIAHCVARHLFAQRVCGLNNGAKVGAAATQQSSDLSLCQGLTC